MNDFSLSFVCWFLWCNYCDSINKSFVHIIWYHKVVNRNSSNWIKFNKLNNHSKKKANPKNPVSRHPLQFGRSSWVMSCAEQDGLAWHRMLNEQFCAGPDPCAVRTNFSPTTSRQPEGTPDKSVCSNFWHSGFFFSLAAFGHLDFKSFGFWFDLVFSGVRQHSCLVCLVGLSHTSCLDPGCWDWVISLLILLDSPMFAYYGVSVHRLPSIGYDGGRCYRSLGWTFCGAGSSFVGGKVR